MAILDYAWSLVPGDRSGALRTCVIPNKQQRYYTYPPWRVRDIYYRCATVYHSSLEHIYTYPIAVPIRRGCILR